MSLNLMTALSLSFDGDAVDIGGDLEPSVIALVDRRGRRLLVPLHGRLNRRRALPRQTALEAIAIADAGFTSGTIH